MRSNVLLLAWTVAALAATRPHYGGTLRVELREPIEEADPPATRPTLAPLNSPYAITVTCAQ